MGAVDIATALSAARKAVRLYPPEHPTHREAVRDLAAAVTDAVDVRPLVLNLREGRIYEGSEVITDATPATRSLTEAMEDRRVESLTFHMGFSEHDATGLSEVLSLRPDPELQVQVELEERDVRGATVSELEDNTAKEAEERDRRRESDRALYRGSLNGLKHTIAALQGDDETEAGGAVEAVDASRPIALLIERVAEEPHAILALAQMTGHGEHWRFHAVGTMLYALVTGRALGLTDQELLGLGLAALLHDTGRALAGDEDPQTLKVSHPIRGAQALGALLDEDRTTLMAAYEHHMGADGSGWPATEGVYTQHPHTKIVAVCNRYDNLIRPATGPVLRPDGAAAQLLREAAAGSLDPAITRVFLGAIGAIPIGSVVRLSDHSIGIVQDPGEDPLLPSIRLILDADGSELRPARDVELAEDERNIVSVLSADLFVMDPSDYL